MSNFSGFSADEISKIHSRTKSERNQNENSTKVNNNNNNNNNNANQRKNEKINNKLVVNEDVNKSETDATVTEIHDAFYFKPLCGDTNKLDEIDLNSIEHEQNKDDDDDEMLSKFRGISFRKLEEHRQIMEEANKEKKKLLTETIEDLLERSTAETQKIAEIKEELNKLDADLANDVNILRNEIEIATINYAKHKKNYDKIEEEFLHAKMELYQSLERKELLAEHLSTIISHNEERKAEKLRQLMEKIGMSSDEQSS